MKNNVPSLLTIIPATSCNSWNLTLIALSRTGEFQRLSRDRKFVRRALICHPGVTAENDLAYISLFFSRIGKPLVEHH